MTIKNNINENNNSDKPTYCPLKIEKNPAIDFAGLLV